MGSGPYLMILVRPPDRPPGYGAGVICSFEEDASASRTSLPSCCFLLTVISLGFLSLQVYDLAYTALFARTEAQGST